MKAAVVDGPLWCDPGLQEHAGRYPLAVEAPVLSGVDTLVPGLSTLTRFARYYSLYWALAAYAGERQLAAADCRDLVRRAEVGLALVSQSQDVPDVWPGQAHGVDRLGRIASDEEAMVWSAAQLGTNSYSPRRWGFWSQYGGPSTVLGTASVDGRAIRPGRHICPPAVTQLFAPLLDLCRQDATDRDQITALAGLRIQVAEPSPDAAPLAGLFAASRNGWHDPDDWNGNDVTRRATLRILARAGQLHPDAPTWTQAFVNAVEHGAQSRQDPVLAAESRVAAWRGVLLRRHSVGAWRRLWAALVDEVLEREVEGLLTVRGDLHSWIDAQLPAGSVAEFEATLPAVTDTHGDPAAAEDLAMQELEPIEADIAILLIGAQRVDSLKDQALAFFLGRTRTYLEPRWIRQVRGEFLHRPVRDLGRRIVDDMLAQARRVSMRKLRLRNDGTIDLFSRLHERNGCYLATSPEGSGDVGLRLPQLSGIATQLGLFDWQDGPVVTEAGEHLLDVHK